MRKLKKLTALLTCAAMALAAAPGRAFAASGGVPFGLLYAVYADHAEITGYSGSAAELDIPAEIGGLPVTAIANDAFSGCAGLVSVSLPESVASVGGRAFRGCTSLERVNLPDAVTLIGYDAFYNTALYNDDANWTDGVLYIDNHLVRARSLADEHYDIRPGTRTVADGAFLLDESEIRSVSIPDSVVSIGSFAFSELDTLESVSIGSGTAYIGEEAFSFCPGLTDVNLPDSVVNIGSYAFADTALYDDDANWTDDVLYIDNHLIKVHPAKAGRCDVRPGTRTVAGSAFQYCEDLESVSLPESLVSVGERAFEGCSSLADASLPAGLTYIGASAFESCSSLASADIPSGVASIGERAFRLCAGLTGVSIASGVASVGARAFEHCILLRSVELPDSVLSIGENAFSRCESLVSASIGSGAASIGERAFYACADLEEITVSERNANYTAIDGVLFDKAETVLIQYPAGNKRTSYAVPDRVTEIGSDSFFGCGVLESVDIPGSVASIGDGAFEYCIRLASVSMSGVVSIGERAFFGCYDLTNAVIPDGAVTIGGEAFSNCHRLVSVSLPESVLSIDWQAFSECERLESVNIPSGTASIGARAFYGCESLAEITVSEDNPNYTAIDGVLFDKSVTELIQYPIGSKRTSYSVPDGVEEIGGDAFFLCSLASVGIPESVVSIGVGAFSLCARLADVYYAGSEEAWEEVEISFNNDSLFKAAKHWNSSVPAPEIKRADFVKNADGGLSVAVETANVPASAKLIAAAFGADGTLIDRASVENGRAALNGEGVKTVKVFCWDSLASLRPLCPAKEAAAL